MVKGQAFRDMEMNSRAETDCDRQRLSCLVDGELGDGAELEAALAEAGSAEALACWQTYHLIGDVLRAPELANSRCDAAWLQQLRERLQQEPADAVPPQAAQDEPLPADLTRQPAANDGIFRWKMVAGLASFAAVAAIGWNVLGSVQPGAAGAGAVLAQGEEAVQPASANVQQVAVSERERRLPARQAWSPAQPPYSVVLRNHELDRLLAQQAGANQDAAARRASEFFRNAGYDTAER